MGRGSGEDEAGRAESLELPLIVAPRREITRVHNALYKDALDRFMEPSTNTWKPTPRPELRSGAERWLRVVEVLRNVGDEELSWDVECFATIEEVAEESIGLHSELRAFHRVYDLASYDPSQYGTSSLQTPKITYKIKMPKVKWPKVLLTETEVARNGEQIYALHPQIQHVAGVALEGEKRFVGVTLSPSGTTARLLGWGGEPPIQDIEYFWKQGSAFVALYDLYGAGGHPIAVPLEVTLQMDGDDETARAKRTFA